MLVRKLLESRGPQFLRRLWTAPTNAAIPASRAHTILPSDVLVEEERIPGYDPKHFYPVNPGDLFPIVMRCWPRSDGALLLQYG